MRKEVLVATIAGIIIGLLVAFGSWRANIALKDKTPEVANQDTVSITKEKGKSPTPQKNEQFALTLTNVEDLDVITDSKLKIIGITKPFTLVVISTENEDFILKSGADGTFEQEVDLDAGVNQILLSAFSQKNERLDKLLTLVYSNEFDKEISDSTKL